MLGRVAHDVRVDLVTQFRQAFFGKMAHPQKRYPGYQKLMIPLYRLKNYRFLSVESVGV